MPVIVEHLRHMRCVVAVALHGSALHAAKTIHASQPTVTRAILHLEAFCGAPLFDRGARGMVPTRLGAVIVARCQRLFAHLEQGAAEALKVGRVRQQVPAPERFARSVSPSSLNALLAIAGTGSESRAAYMLGVTQPAINRSLQRLQERAGTRLFLRSAAGTQITPAGDALVLRVKLAFAEARAIESEIAAWRGELRGRVVVGALPFSIGASLSDAVCRVMSQHPEIEIRIVEGTYESLSRQLLSADIDVLFGALRDAPRGIRQEALFEDDMVAVARRDHPCLRGSPSLRSLLQWEWVVPVPDTTAVTLFERAFALRRLKPPRALLEASSVSFIRSLVRCSDRLAFYGRRQAIEDERSGVMRIVPVALPGTARVIGASLRDTGAPSLNVGAFLAALRAATHDAKSIT